MKATALALSSEWRGPAFLVLLGLVPAMAGTARLLELASGVPITPDNMRFMTMPMPVVLHVLSVIPYSMLGAFQISSSFRRRNVAWHRAAGRLLVGLGLTAALSGLWMANFYPWPAGDGVALYLERLVFGSAMAASIIIAVNAIRRRDFTSHGEWMIRAYAIGMGAGTQVLTHLPWFLLVGRPDESVRAVLMGAGWVINLAFAEYVIRSARSGRVAVRQR